MTIGKYVIAFGAALSFVGAVVTVAQADEPAPAKRHHAHHAYHASATNCWINSDKGFDRGVYGLYGPCNTPGAVAVEYSVWGRGSFAADTGQ
ncbi:MAG TPA: hypothetical protein VFB45_06470 [Pseudolabrys sp.]|nr:hypothetical protein [Pseudolabrys sp.]